MCSQPWLLLSPTPIVVVKQKREVIARVAAPIKEEWQTNIHGPSKWSAAAASRLHEGRMITYGFMMQLMTASVRACLP
jgi:hypothetical protein